MNSTAPQSDPFGYFARKAEREADIRSVPAFRIDDGPTLAGYDALEARLASVSLAVDPERRADGNFGIFDPATGSPCGVAYPVATPLRSYASEFPNYPANAIPALPDGWRDASWCNDACPFFVHEETGFALWCDYPDSSRRDDPKIPHYQFVQMLTRDAVAGWQHGDADPVALVCDDLGAVRDVLDHIATDGATLADALQSGRMRLNQLTVADARELLAAELAHDAGTGRGCPDLCNAMRDIMASDPRAMTLDGAPARMRLTARFGFIARRDGKGGDVEFSVSAIAAVLASGGAFKS